LKKVRYAGIEDFTALEELRVSNSVGGLDNTTLTIDISNNLNLRILECNNNAITNLDVSNNTSLVRLSCYNNLLTNLDVSNNVDLYFLYSGCPTMTSLDLSNNINLKNLAFRGQFTEIDLSNNILLQTISIAYNSNLSSLDISHLNSLTMFHANWGLPNLTCITVNDVAAANAISNLSIAPQVYFSLTCP
jgi:hypothetical protein